MDIKELFKGVAVVIDDEVNKSDTLIYRITENFEQEGIPLIKYEYLPTEDNIKHFQNISFILLDWQLFGNPEPDIPFDEAIHINQIIRFLKSLNEKYFLPIFIFSKENRNDIIRKLVENGLYEEEKNNYIFVKKKEDLISNEDKNKLFTEIEDWLKQTPAIYVLKEWENSLIKAKNKLFWDFYNINHKWPSVLQKTFTDDGSDVNYELGNFIFKNIMARTEPIKFDEEILKLEDDDLSIEELRKVLEAERFIKNESLPPSYPAIGDLFELFQYEVEDGSQKEKKKLFINIRPDCDIIRDKDNIKKGDKSLKNIEENYNPYLYCLECEILKDKNFEIDKGAIIERKNSTIIPFVYGNKILKINFDKLFLFGWKQNLYQKEGKEQRSFNIARVGRILPPYITAIQQKYSFYLQRQGLPAIPERAIKDD